MGELLNNGSYNKTNGLLFDGRGEDGQARSSESTTDRFEKSVDHLQQLVALLSNACIGSLIGDVLEDVPVPLLFFYDVTPESATVNSAARNLLNWTSASSQIPSWLCSQITMLLMSNSGERSSEISRESQNGESQTLQIELRRLARPGLSGVIVALYDVSKHKAVEQALRMSEARYRILLEHQSDLVLKIDLHGIIQFASPSFSKMFGVTESEVSGQSFFTYVAGDKQAEFLERLHKKNCRQQACYEEITLQTAQGARCYGWSLKALAEQGDAASGYICIGRDITEQKEAEYSIHQLAYYDNLTALPNRVLLQDRLHQILSQTNRNEKKFAVLFLDLDRFKSINDSLGHAAGDELLKQVAHRLKENIRGADTVARQGGDEFVVLLSSIESSRQAARVASKIISTITHPFQVAGRDLQIGTSIGIALFPDDGRDADTLLKHADMAMYLAKESGRGKFTFFSHELNDRMRERSTMEAALKKAIEQNELFLQYQPQFNIKNRYLTSLEAFVRWNHPEYGVLMPGRFIPLAEETGLIIPLGEWVLKAACAQAAMWQSYGRGGVPVSVNLSTRQFRHPELSEMVARSLVIAGLPPHSLELEIQEHTLLDNVEASISVLEELKWQGIQLTIDDFGTGYSSLSHLRRFPINRLKIDSSFIRNVHSRSEDADITEAIISVGRSLKMSVVAEGVEREEQLLFLRDHMCDEMQGNYFSSPVGSRDLAHCRWFGANA